MHEEHIAQIEGGKSLQEHERHQKGSKSNAVRAWEPGEAGWLSWPPEASLPPSIWLQHLQERTRLPCTYLVCVFVASAQIAVLGAVLISTLLM